MKRVVVVYDEQGREVATVNLGRGYQAKVIENGRPVLAYPEEVGRVRSNVAVEQTNSSFLKDLEDSLPLEIKTLFSNLFRTLKITKVQKKATFYSQLRPGWTVIAQHHPATVHEAIVNFTNSRRFEVGVSMGEAGIKALVPELVRDFNRAIANAHENMGAQLVRPAQPAASEYD